MKKSLFTLSTAFLAVLIGTSSIKSTNHNSGSSVKTNSTCTSCHSGSKAAGVAAKGSVTITGIPATAVAGQSYPIIIIIKDLAAKSYGFNAITNDGKFTTTAAGTSTTAIATTTYPNRYSLHHTTKIVATPNAADSNFTLTGITWTAPATAGSVTVAIGALATNNNGSTSGDHAYSSTLTTKVVLDSTLPIKLSSFNINSAAGKVNLSWSSSTETNVASFAIERSINGTTFSTVGNVAAIGNSSSLHSYSYSDDASKLSGTIYYRLKTLDKDGKFTYSAVQQVVVKASKNLITKMYPNPLSNGQDIKLAYTSLKSGVVKVQVLNSLGKQVANSNLAVTEGSNSLTVATPHLAAGIYYVSVTSENTLVERLQLMVK